MSILQQSYSKFTSVLLFGDTSFDSNKSIFILDATIDYNRKIDEPLFHIPQFLTSYGKHYIVISMLYSIKVQNFHLTLRERERDRERGRERERETQKTKKRKKKCNAVSSFLISETLSSEECNQVNHCRLEKITFLMKYMYVKWSFRETQHVRGNIYIYIYIIVRF